jgi:F0F1-type ATP synthase assembly protein I
MAPESPNWQTLLGMGVVDAVVIGIGLGLGLLVDSLLDTTPVFLMIGLALGVVAVVAYTVARFKEFLKH